MTLPKPPKAITFDCWSTLIVDRDTSSTFRTRVERLEALAAREGVRCDTRKAEALLEEAWEAHLAAWRRGRPFGPQAAARWCLEALGIDPRPQLEAEVSEAIASATQVSGVEVLPGAAEVLERLRRRGIPTALISDTGFTPGSEVRPTLDHLGLELDHYVFSDEVGAPKPDPRIFAAALDALGVAPEVAVHVGDLRRTDIAGARAAGMGTVRYAGVHDDAWSSIDAQGEEADAVIHSWSELVPLLGL